MSKRNHGDAIASPADSPVGTSHILITRVVTECHEFDVRPGTSGPTIGEMIDQHLSRAASDGHSVQTVALHISPEHWEAVQDAYRFPVR